MQAGSRRWASWSARCRVATGRRASFTWAEARNVREPQDVLYFSSIHFGDGMIRSEELDVIIVGGGPAGPCAAMYAGRGLLRSVLLERGVPGGELLNTEWIDDYPGFEHVLGRELAAKMDDHAVRFGADIRQENVEAITR